MNLLASHLRRERRFSGRRRFLLALVAASALGLTGAAALPVIQGKTESPRYGLEAAEKAIHGARKAQAARWAPQELMTAEAAMRAAWIEQRTQEARFFLLRDFTTARSSLALAEQKALHAAASAVKKRKEAESAAEAAITEADALLAATKAFAEAMHLGMFERTLFQKASLVLKEATILESRGEYVAALDRAGTASALARQVGERAVLAASRYAEPGAVRSWKRMAEDTIAWSRQTGAAAVVVYKENHRLTLYDGGRAVRSYRVELGYNNAMDKSRAGDAATPEGRYRITAKKGAGNSTYYKALLLDYPNAEDRREFERLKRAGHLPRWARMGGLIEIHGEGGKGKDWTKGCVAVSNSDMDDLFRRVGIGTPVTIVGGDGNGGTFTELVRRFRSANGEGTNTR